MVSVAVMDLSTPACGAVHGVVDWEAEFSEYVVFDIPVLEALDWGAPTHAHQWIRRWDV